ncbi:unnamed protein product, partial [Ectocarpus sp. 13 AM-2016]
MSPPQKGEGGAVGAAAGGLEGDGGSVASRHERAEHVAKTTAGQGSRCACATASAPPHDPTAAATHSLRPKGGQPQRQPPGSNPSNGADTAAMTMQLTEVEGVGEGRLAAADSGSSWAGGRSCEACGKVFTRDLHPSFACRACRKLYHRSCVGYVNRSRQSPPPDWICPHCPDGERGPGPQLHHSVAGKGTVKQRKGNMPWCPICLRDDRLPNSTLMGRLNSGSGNHRRRSRGGEGGGGGGGADGGAKSKAKGKRRLEVVSTTGQDGGGETGGSKGKAGQSKRRKTISCGAAGRTIGEEASSGVTSESLNRGAAPRAEEDPPARQQRARQRRASTGRGGGSNDNGNAATADPTPASAAAAAAAAGTVCFKCKKKRSGSNKLSGKTCGTCGRWWHNSVHCCGAYGCPESGEWVGGWRCRHCLSLWEKGLRDRAAKVVEAWNDQDARRERDAPLHRETAAAAAAESKATRRHGFSVAAVEI